MMCSKGKRLIALTILALSLVSCGGEGDQENLPPLTNDSSDIDVTSVFSGSVGDGPITGAVIAVYDVNGNMLSTTTSTSSANYQITVRTGNKSYPLTLTANGGTDIVSGTTPDFTLASTVLTPADRRNVNINPYTTFIVKTANYVPGGLTGSNVAMATQYVVNALNYGLDTAMIQDPISIELGNATIANFIKSAEVLSEAVRRTRGALISQGVNLTADEVANAMSSDLVDGVINGQGAADADPRIAATFNLVTAQVGMEAMVNNLRVNGAVATGALDNAIRVSMPGALPTASTSNVRINQRLIEMTKTSVLAARVINTSSELDSLAAAMDNINAGLLPPEVEAILPENVDIAIANSIQQLASASGADLESINAVVTNGGETGSSGGGADGGSDQGTGGDNGGGTGSGNAPPVITGTPATSVIAGNPYTLTVRGSDPDGTILSFNITSRPAWARFVDNRNNTATLSGTPQSGDVGMFRNIVIGASSDGSANVALPAFSIEVLADNSVPPPPVEELSADFSATPTSGIASLTVNFSAAQSSSITQYQWNFGDGSTATGPNQTHVYNTTGIYYVQLTVSNADGQTATAQDVIQVNSPGSSSGNYLTGREIFVDDQNYTITTSDNINTFRGGSAPAGAPWTSLKVRNGTDAPYPASPGDVIGNNRGSGWIYTVDAIPGDPNPIPGAVRRRALCIENYSTTLGTQDEIRISYGSQATDTIPPDVWFQFWIYFPADPVWTSTFGNPKFIYPNKDSAIGGTASYATDRLDWLVHLGIGSKVPSFVRENELGARYFKPFSEDSGSAMALYYPWTTVGHTNTGDENFNFKMTHVNPNTGLMPGRWHLVLLHFDTSVTAESAGTHVAEGYMRPYGDLNWKMMYRWQNGQDYQPVIAGYGRGGTFTWNLRGSQRPDRQYGHRSISWPTTLVQTDASGGNMRFYISDFAMAAGVNSGGNGIDDLPVYNDY